MSKQEKFTNLEAIEASKLHFYLDDCHQISVQQILAADTLDSTQDWLLNAIKTGKDYRVATTDLQTAGRGKQGRVWHGGTKCTNFAFSFSYTPKSMVQSWAGLTLLLGIAVVGALKTFGIKEGLALKWPNDLYLDGRKLGGILVELTKFKEQSILVIGTGINLAPPKVATGEKLISASLSEKLPEQVLAKRNQFLGGILDQMLAACEQYEQFGLEPWLDIWNDLDFTANKTVAIDTAKRKLIGRDLGIDAKGRLLLGLNEKDVIALNAGEVQLFRPTE